MDKNVRLTTERQATSNHLISLLGPFQFILLSEQFIYKSNDALFFTKIKYSFLTIRQRYDDSPDSFNNLQPKVKNH